MSVEKYIHGKVDRGHHEGKRSEMRRLDECREDVIEFLHGDVYGRPKTRKCSGNEGFESSPSPHS